MQLIAFVKSKNDFKSPDINIKINSHDINLEKIDEDFYKLLNIPSDFSDIDSFEITPNRDNIKIEYLKIINQNTDRIYFFNLSDTNFLVNESFITKATGEYKLIFYFTDEIDKFTEDISFTLAIKKYRLH